MTKPEARYDLMQYSPVNSLMVDWAAQGKRFNRCGLPHRRSDRPTVHIEGKSDVPDCSLPILPSIETYDWSKWLPEIIVGIDDPSEEIAADYSRAAAIQFCKYTRALQREIVMPLEHGLNVYPVVPVDFENVVGVIGAAVNDGERRYCNNNIGYLDEVRFLFDSAKSEIHIDDSCRCESDRFLRLLVYAAPRESACEYDSFLYEFFRREIVMRARLEYVRAVHFRDKLLIASLISPSEIDMEWLKAKNRVTSINSFTHQQSDVGSFGGGYVWHR